MQKKITEVEGASRVVCGGLEAYARMKIQKFIQALLEEEVTEFVGAGRAGMQPTGGGRIQRISQRLGEAASARPRPWIAWYFSECCCLPNIRQALEHSRQTYPTPRCE